MASNKLKEELLGKVKFSNSNASDAGTVIEVFRKYGEFDLGQVGKLV